MKKKRVAIVGCGNSAKHVERLFGDLDKYEIWGMNQLFVIYPAIVPKATRWFQVHHEDKFLEGNHNTFEWMKEEHPFPIYVREKYVDDFPSAVPFPKHELLEEFGRYWGSCVAWMMGLAIHEEFEEIHLYGVHMALPDEYANQKDGIEYFIGLARGRGIKVFVPPTCELLKTPFLYGFEDPSHLFHKVTLQLKEIEFKEAEVKVKRNKNRDKRNQLWGGLNLHYSDEKAEKEATDHTRELVKEDWLLNEELNQLIGSRATYKYLLNNWICNWYPGGVGNGESENQTFIESCNDSRDEGAINDI